MKKLILYTLLSGISICFVTSCKSTKQTALNNECNTGAAVIRNASNEKGTLIKDETSGRYAIRVATPGTIDEVNTYLICNIPSDLPKVNSMVTFSGKIRTSDQVSNLGGLTYYDIEISSLE